MEEVESSCAASGHKHGEKRRLPKLAQRKPSRAQPVMLAVTASNLLFLGNTPTSTGLQPIHNTVALAFLWLSFLTCLWPSVYASVKPINTELPWVQRRATLVSFAFLASAAAAFCDPAALPTASFYGSCVLLVLVMVS